MAFIVFGLLAFGLPIASAQTCMEKVAGLATKCPLDKMTGWENASSEEQQEVMQVVCDPGDCKTAVDELAKDCGEDMTAKAVLSGLEMMCSPCAKVAISAMSEMGDSGKCPDMNSLSSPSAAAVTKVCSSGCTSILDSLATACKDSNEAGIQSLVKARPQVQAMCQPCTKSYLMLPQSCQKSDGPNIEAACGDCRSPFESMVAACPENPTESPIMEVKLTDYTMVRAAIVGALGGCPTTTTTTTPAQKESADGAFRHGVVATGVLSLALPLL